MGSQVGNGVVLNDDAGAAAGQRMRGAFEDLHVTAGGEQPQRGVQAAERPADDGDPQPVTAGRRAGHEQVPLVEHTPVGVPSEVSAAGCSSLLTWFSSCTSVSAGCAPDSP